MFYTFPLDPSRFMNSHTAHYDTFDFLFALTLLVHIAEVDIFVFCLIPHSSLVCFIFVGSSIFAVSRSVRPDHISPKHEMSDKLDGISDEEANRGAYVSWSLVSLDDEWALRKSTSG
jgi:flagellar biosynthesis component FlhA